MSVRKNEKLTQMKSFEESNKSKKTVESMIVTSAAQGKTSNNNNVAAKKKTGKNQGSVTFSSNVSEPISTKENGSSSNEGSDKNDQLDEEQRIANIARLQCSSLLCNTFLIFWDQNLT